jgi:N-acetylneuraminic acid mutarotase
MNRKVIATKLAIAILMSCLLTILNINTVAAPEDSWEAMATMPTARSNLGVCNVNGKVYAIGGAGYPENLAVNEMYDAATNTWTNKQSMPTPRYNFGIAVYMNKVYCIGGLDRACLSVNEVYDPATDTWDTKKPMPVLVRSPTLSVINGKLYLLGVLETSSTSDPIASTQVYDPATDTWEIGKPMPTNVLSFASTTLDNKIYVIGGGHYEAVFTFKPINDVQIYDYVTDSWSYGVALPLSVDFGLEALAAVATSGIYAPKKIYVFGSRPSQYINYHLAYDPLTDSWSFELSMPSYRKYFGVTVVDDILYAIGGSMQHSIAINERYAPLGYYSPLPNIQIISPDQNKTYDADNVTLKFNVDRAVSKLSYSLDEEVNVTITGNTTLTGLSNGIHSVIVYAFDQAGNVGASEIALFNVTRQQNSEPFPTALITIVIVVVAVGAMGFLFYFKKRKH